MAHVDHARVFGQVVFVAMLVERVKIVIGVRKIPTGEILWPSLELVVSFFGARAESSAAVGMVLRAVILLCLPAFVVALCARRRPTAAATS